MRQVNKWQIGIAGFCGLFSLLMGILVFCECFLLSRLELYWLLLWIPIGIWLTVGIRRDITQYRRLLNQKEKLSRGEQSLQASRLQASRRAKVQASRTKKLSRGEQSLQASRLQASRRAKVQASRTKKEEVVSQQLNEDDTPFAHLVSSQITGIAVDLAKRLANEWEQGRLERGQYVAMLFQTIGPAELQKLFLRGDMRIAEYNGVLKDLHEDELPRASAPFEGYIVLLLALSYSLRQVMSNNPELAAEIGVSHAELLQNFSAISGIDQQMLTDGITAIAKFVAENDGDPRVMSGYTAIQFLQTMSVKPPRSYFSHDTLDHLVLDMALSDATLNMVGEFRTALTDSTITTLADLCLLITGIQRE